MADTQGAQPTERAPFRNRTGLTDAEARRFHRVYTRGVMAFVGVSVLAYLLAFALCPAFTGIN